MLLIRHGQSEFNVVFNKTRVDPGIEDPKLTEEGRRQAETAGRALRGRPPRRLISSPYTRAIETAHIIADVLGGLAIDIVDVFRKASDVPPIADEAIAVGAKVLWQQLGVNHAEAVKKAGGYISTIWNKTDDLHPWDIGDNYVAHLSWSGEKPSEEAANILIKAMGGEGAIVHLGGIPANIPAIERLNGLKNAIKKNPKVQLLDSQPADWDTTKAAALMSNYLTKYGNKIKGVHCANDNMAYGVLQALKAEGINLPVTAFDGNPEAVEMVMKGDLLATVFTNPHWGGGIALGLAHQAALGKFKPSEEPKEHREFYGPSILVTKADADAFKKKYLDSTPKYDWSDRWGLSAGQIQYK